MVSAAIAPFIRKVFHSVFRSLPPDSGPGMACRFASRSRVRTSQFEAGIGLVAGLGRAKNLDDLPHSPYTTAVPGNGRDFGPPRAPRDALAYGGDGRGFC